MKRKELFKRLTAVSMSAIMAVTMVPTTAFASEDGFFADEQEVTAEVAESAETSDLGESDFADESEGFASDEEEGLGSGEEFISDDEEETDAFSDFQTEEETEEENKEVIPAADAVVHFTMSNAGVLANAKDGSLMAQKDVTVTDLDKNGILTYDEALKAAHDAYFEGGAEVGYATADSEQYGKYLTKLWGDESGAFGYRLNDVSCNSLSDPVKEGDYLTAFIYKDKEKYSDVYTRFVKREYNATATAGFYVKVQSVSYDSKYTYIEDAGLKVYDSNFNPLPEEEYTLGPNDSFNGYQLKFKNIGTYYVVTAGTEALNLVPAITKVNVRFIPKFEDVKIYRDEKAYIEGSEPIEMTPAFDGNINQEYSIEAPDYLKSFYVAVTLPQEVVDTYGRFIFVSNRWDGWSGTGASEGRVITADAYIIRTGYINMYYSEYPGSEIKVNVKQNTTLSELKIDGIVDKAFDRDENTYHAYVDSTAEGVVLTPTAYKNTYNITINGVAVKSGEAYTLPYDWDENGKMTAKIEVAGEGKTTSTYTVNLEKQPLEDAPAILKQPKNADYIVGDTATEMTVVASANGEMTYQWYSNTVDSNVNGVKIEGATEASYVPSAENVGTTYYYCVVTNKDKTENNTTATNTASVVVDPDPTPVATFTTLGEAMPDDGYEYECKTGYIYEQDAESTPLAVDVRSAVEGGKYSYKWYIARNNYGDDYYTTPTQNTSSTYVPPTGRKIVTNCGIFYKCKVTYTYKGKEYSSFATTGEQITVEDQKGTHTYDVNGIYVFVKTNGASTPVLTRKAESADYLVGDKIDWLYVEASTEEYGLDDYARVTYDWYMNDKASTDGGTKIEGDVFTGKMLDIEDLGLQPTDKSSTKYYYCVITNNVQGYTASMTAPLVKISVRTGDELIGDTFSESGTQEDPYLIKTADDYQKVANVVAAGASFAGKYLRQENDITLPAGWKPIGVTKNGSIDIDSGKNLNAFSGYLDGNGKTLTIPEGGKPLLGYVKGAEVHNLNIYGTKIAGYGLVNNLSGVGLSGSAIVIDNVTLKSGSSTLKAGLIGTSLTTNPYAGCSAAFKTTIRNCTIEKDVVIGYNKNQSMIGSIAGRIHGTIENCVSYATVYGKSYVGGILGTRDNAMGECSVKNGEFYGTVEASGKYAGGIVGSGYTGAQAPNGQRISVNKCISAGTVTGSDGVGGILGGDFNVVQAWNGYSFTGNSFTGTVKATEGTYVGGIIGYYESLNKLDNIANNYYTEACGAAKGIGFVKYVDTNCETHEETSGALYFSTEKNTDACPEVSGCTWKIGYNRTDDPLGADSAKLTSTEKPGTYIEELELDGTYRTEFYIGEELDLTGMIVRAKMNVGNDKIIPLSEVTVTGYEKEKRGEQTLTISYNDVTTTLLIKVLRKEPETIKVKFSLLGDKLHNSDEDKEYHTLHANNLETWIGEEEYEVGGNATVLDVVSKVLTENEYSFKNESGDYISAIITKDGEELGGKTNGENSGWMYTLNGIHSDLTVKQQYLEDGDIIVFHYTDDYTQEHDHIWESEWSYDENAHWHECTYTYNKCDITDNTKKGGYAAHTFDEGKVTKEATCKEEGVKTYTCTVCGYEKTEVIPKTDVHTFDEGKITKEATYKETGEKVYTCKICGATKTETIPVLAHDHDFTWTRISKATVFQAEKQEGICSICGEKQTREVGTALKAIARLNVKSIPLQKNQITKKVKVTMANGDSVVSWKSSSRKIAKVDKNGVIKAGKKTGTAKITVTLKSGKTATLTVNVQKAKVATRKLKGLKSSVIVKKGKKLALKPVISPITSQEKVTYSSSNEKVVTVSSKGVITGKKKGTAKITVKSGKKSFTVKVKVK